MIFLKLFLSFFKIGALTFGGGMAMLPLIREEALSNGWIDEAALVDFIAVSESTPGPIAVNLATYVGQTVGGFFGAVSATLGVALPSFIIILIIARVFEKFKKSTVISGLMTGLRPCVVGLIGAALISVAKTVFFPAGLSLSVFASPSLYIFAGIFALSTVLSFKKLHPIIIICICAVLGIAHGYLGEILHF